MTIEINAFDTLFFRDGKPFSMGDDVWADGVFPPSPGVFYGMLQTAYAAENNLAPKDIAEATKNLKIEAVYLKSDGQTMFPFPADLLVTGSEKDEKIGYLKLRENNLISSLSARQYPMLLFAETRGKVRDYNGKAFLDHINFTDYLQGRQEISAIKTNDLITIEPKVGIGKSLTSNQTEEGKLYRVGMIRPDVKNTYKKLSFVVDFTGIEFQKKSGFLRIGAESKIAFFKATESQETKLPETKNDLIKVYLATPAIFEQGPLPDFMIKKEFEGIQFELLTYAMGKPVYIGGFDLLRGKPKPMKRAVPAGSIYYLKSDTAAQLAEKLHRKNISDFDTAKMGFGKIFIGAHEIEKS